jgi:hypothetical protein
MRHGLLTPSVAFALILATIVVSDCLAGSSQKNREEENIIRTAYAKMSYGDEVRIVLDALVRTGRDELWTSRANLVDRALDSRLSFELSDFDFGKISSIADHKIGDFDGSSAWIGGDALDVTPSVYNYSVDNAPSTYVTYIKFAWRPSPYRSLSPVESWPIARALQSEQFEGKKHTDYATYTVTVTLGGKSRTYNAWALFRLDEKGKNQAYFMDAIADPTAVTFGVEHSFYPQAFVETDLRTVPFVDKWLHDNARTCSVPHSEKDNNRDDVRCDPHTGRCGVAQSSLAGHESRRVSPEQIPPHLVPASFHISSLPLHPLLQAGSSTGCTVQHTQHHFPSRSPIGLPARSVSGNSGRRYERNTISSWLVTSSCPSTFIC